MQITKQNTQRARRVIPLFGMSHWSVKMSVAGFLIFNCVATAHAGYLIKGQVESASSEDRYTWNVRNEDQGWGLDKFAIEVPVKMRVLAYTVPPPYATNARGTSRWVMMEARKAQVDPHDGRAWLPAAKPGKKWIIWRGCMPASVYPPGSTVMFSLTTDVSAKRGTVTGMATTYTPQANPHFYTSFQADIVGPNAIANDDQAVDLKKADVQMIPARFQSGRAANPHAAADMGKLDDSVKLSIGMYPGLTIEGAVGKTYGIQYCTNLSDPKGWHAVASVTLKTAKQIWIDPQPSSTQRFYRIAPGSISAP